MSRLAALVLRPACLALAVALAGQALAVGAGGLTATPASAQPVVALSKAVSNLTQRTATGPSTTAYTGDVVEYTITYSVTGTSAATPLTVNDVVQAGQAYQSGSCTASTPGTTCSFNAATNTVTYSIPAAPGAPSGSAYFLATITAGAGSTVPNQASATAAGVAPVVSNTTSVVVNGAAPAPCTTCTCGYGCTPCTTGCGTCTTCTCGYGCAPCTTCTCGYGCGNCGTCGGGCGTCGGGCPYTCSGGCPSTCATGCPYTCSGCATIYTSCTHCVTASCLGYCTAPTYACYGCGTYYAGCAVSPCAYYGCAAPTCGTTYYTGCGSCAGTCTTCATSTCASTVGAPVVCGTVSNYTAAATSYPGTVVVDGQTYPIQSGTSFGSVVVTPGSAYCFLTTGSYVTGCLSATPVAATPVEDPEDLQRMGRFHVI